MPVIPTRAARELLIVPVSPAGSPLTLPLGPEGSQRSAGNDWQLVNRPKRKALTEWTGVTPYRQIIPVMLDGWAEGHSVAPTVERLRRIERVPYDVDDDRRPAVVRIAGPVVWLPQLRWVLESIEWGEALRDDAGTVLRQSATLHFLEYVAADLLIEDSPAQRARQRAGA